MIVMTIMDQLCLKRINKKKNNTDSFTFFLSQKTNKPFFLSTSSSDLSSISIGCWDSFFEFFLFKKFVPPRNVCFPKCGNNNNQEETTTFLNLLNPFFFRNSNNYKFWIVFSIFFPFFGNLKFLFLFCEVSRFKSLTNGRRSTTKVRI